MSALRKKITAFFLGLACALVVLELLLRLVGVSSFVPGAHLPENTLREMDPKALRVLCVGNSHTEGAAETVSGSYPSQLEARLTERFPGKAFQVINAGRGNWNSSEILDYLPGFLARYKPHAVFVMAGEPNAWNYRYFYKHESRYAWLLDRLRLLKSVRLLDLLLRFSPEGEREKSELNAFLDLPWFEYPTLAMSWVRHTEKNPELSRIPSGDLAVAEEALGKWTRSPLGKNRQLALSLLARIQLHQARYGEAAATIAKLLALPGKPFDLSLWTALGTGSASATFKNELQELRQRAPTEASLARFQRIVRGEEATPAGDQHFLETFAAAAPGRLETYKSLAALYRKEKKSDKIKDVYAAAERENPLGEGVRDFLLSLREVSQNERIEIGRATLVPMFTTYQNGAGLGEGPRLAVGSDATPELLEAEFSRVQRWAMADLRKISELARDAGASVVLQTYPLYRKSGLERWPDALIRAVAKEEGIPLADTSAEFQRFLSGKAREDYYFKAGRAFQDDHLNTKGNAVVAEQMLLKLEGLGLLK